MATTRVVRIDQDVWRWLQSQAVPLRDTPNSVLRRMAGLDNEVPPPLPVSKTQIAALENDRLFKETKKMQWVRIYMKQNQVPLHKKPLLPSDPVIFAREVPLDANVPKIRRNMRKLALRFFGPGGSGQEGYAAHLKQHDDGTCPCQHGEEE